MILTESPRLREEVLRLLRAEYHMDEKRTGTHVSSLIYCLTKSFYEETDPLPVTDEELGLFSIGYGLERVYIPRVHAEPFEVDGITLSPDMTLLGLPSDLKSTRMATTTSAGCAVCGEPYRGHTGRCTCGHQKVQHGDEGCVVGVGETQPEWCPCLTFTRHAYEKAPPVPFELPVGWQKQFMAYVYGTQNRPQDELCSVCKHAESAHHNGIGCLMCSFVAGIHMFRPVARGGGVGSGARAFGVVVVHLISAEIRAYEARWSTAELQANWDWLLERKATRERLLRDNTPEPYRHRLYPEECNTCRMNLVCGLQASIDQLKEKAVES